MDKIKTLEELATLIHQAKAEGKRVVQCHGVFDLLHPGHIRHFQQARAHGDILVVTLTADRYVNKGAHRPAFPEKLRAETLSALSTVDYVAINQWPTAVETLRMLRPDVYCKGGEYRKNQVDAQSNMLPEVATARELNIEMAFTDDIVFSSSELLNQHFSPFPAATDVWLRDFRTRHGSDGIIRCIDTLRNLRVLIVGEAIVDEYVFVHAIGKSTKDPVLACRFLSNEAFAGGALAIANHLADFCDKVGVVTYLGDHETREEFIGNTLDSRVDFHFIHKQNASTIVKRRYVDQYSQNKLFELYMMNDQPLREENEKCLFSLLDGMIADYDIVIAADYGHGLMTRNLITLLCEKSNFLAINTQSNAGNHGFNPVSRYPRADYVCLAAHEVSMETRMREGNLRDLLIDVTQRIECDRFTVTMGKEGSLHYTRNEGFATAPSLAMRVVDRVGAGDAVLALTSLLIHQKAPWDVVGFIGNAAGALMVTELGNRIPIHKIALCKYIISLMK